MFLTVLFLNNQYYYGIIYDSNFFQIAYFVSYKGFLMFGLKIAILHIRHNYYYVLYLYLCYPQPWLAENSKYITDYKSLECQDGLGPVYDLAEFQVTKPLLLALYSNRGSALCFHRAIFTDFKKGGGSPPIFQYVFYIFCFTRTSLPTIVSSHSLCNFLCRNLEMPVFFFNLEGPSL